MGEPFAQGSYIDDQRDIRFGDGDQDAHGRWVDAEGWVRLGPHGSGEIEDGRYVDIDGQLHEADGTAVDLWFGLPTGWQVPVEGFRSSVDTVPPQGYHPDPQAPTGATSPSADAMRAFQAGITRAQATDALGDPLTFAGTDPPASAAGLARHRLLPDYHGEDEYSDAFSAGMLRRSLQHDDQYTTIYDPSETDSVQRASVGDEGLLVDGRGAPLSGTFGYVVDPSDGSLHLFDQAEAWVTKGGEWVSLAGVDAQPDMIRQAVARGEKVRSVHHSTPLAGRPVAGAGTLTVTQGVITEISDRSGHYQPEAEYLWQTVEWLRAQGMDVASIDVTMIEKGATPETVLKGWQVELTRGNQAQAALKDKVHSDLDRWAYDKAQQERVAALQRQAQQQETPATRHFRATGCASYLPSQDGTYCMGCDQDL